MKDAVLNVDMTFFTNKAYKGAGYITQDWNSYSDFQSEAQKWLSIHDFIMKCNLERRRGSYVFENKQLLYNIQRIIKDEYISKFDFVHMSAHHDIFSWYPLNHYRVHALHDYQNFDYNIALFKEKWIHRLIWIVPSWFTQDDITEQFSFRQEISKSNENTYICHFVEGISIEIKVVKFDEWLCNYNWKYINVVMNKKISKFDPNYLEELKKYISTW